MNLERAKEVTKQCAMVVAALVLAVPYGIVWMALREEPIVWWRRKFGKSR
jgi:hypothetical protein